MQHRDIDEENWTAHSYQSPAETHAKTRAQAGTDMHAIMHAQARTLKHARAHKHLPARTLDVDAAGSMEVVKFPDRSRD